MPIGVKGGSLIVKDGRLADGCGCCGWYCYRETDCPCNYSKALPPTLNASLAFTLSENVYGGFLYNFVGAQVGPTRVTPTEAAAINGTYVLSRQASTCLYRFTNGNVTIAVTVGASHVCSSGGFSVSLDELAFTVQGKTPSFSGSEIYSGAVNTACNGIPLFLTGAASKTYTDPVSIICPGSPTTLSCPSGNYDNFYNRAFGLGLYPSGRDNPQCSSPLIDVVNHSWAIDALYTNTSGAAPSLGTVSRAITLTVSE